MSAFDLQAENEALKLRVAWLEGELGLSQEVERIGAIRKVFHLTPAQASVISALARAYPRAVQMWALDEMLPKRDPNSIVLKTHINRIRTKLGKSAIVTAGSTYQISPLFAAQVEAATRIARAA